MLRSLDTSASAMSALRTQLDVISNNIANVQSLTDAQGNYSPYRRKQVLFAVGNPLAGSDQGVHVAGIREDYNTPLISKFEPHHPFADEQGNVYYPNVKPLVEMTDAMVTIRAYQANATAFESAKSMMASALRLLA